jgi:hypothetical protein
LRRELVDFFLELDAFFLELDDFRELEDFRELADFFLREPVAFFFGTLPPDRRASLRPIAIACLRLVTFFPDDPERSVPCLRSCIAFFTFF